MCSRWCASARSSAPQGLARAEVDVRIRRSSRARLSTSFGLVSGVAAVTASERVERVLRGMRRLLSDLGEWTAACRRDTGFSGLLVCSRKYREPEGSTPSRVVGEEDGSAKDGLDALVSSYTAGRGIVTSDLGFASYRRVLHVELCRAPADVASRTRAHESPDSSHHMSCARRRLRYRRRQIPRFRSSMPVVRAVDLRLLVWIYVESHGELVSASVNSPVPVVRSGRYLTCR